MKIFLGGTCNESKWRDELINNLSGSINYFNPLVDDWTPECQEEEIRQRKLCDFVLYVITPKMTGLYSIAEAVDDSNKQPYKTIFCVLDEDEGLYFSDGQRRSLFAVSKLIEKNGGKIFISIYSTAKWLNDLALIENNEPREKVEL